MTHTALGMFREGVIQSTLVKLSRPVLLREEVLWKMLNSDVLGILINHWVLAVVAQASRGESYEIKMIDLP